jgi:hypothetical protein
LSINNESAMKALQEMDETPFSKLMKALWPRPIHYETITGSIENETHPVTLMNSLIKKPSKNAYS